MANSEEIQQVFRLLNVNYPNYAKSLLPGVLKEQLELWQKLLADLPCEILKASALQHMASSQWFPTVSELRNGAGAIAAPAARVAIEAWGDVVTEMASPRSYRYADGFHEFPKFTDPLVQKIVDSMGWGNLCGSDDTTADRARFLQAYEAMARRATEDRMQLPVVRDLVARLTMQRSERALPGRQAPELLSPGQL